MTTAKNATTGQAIKPEPPQSSGGYSATAPVPYYGKMRDGLIVEAADEDEPHYSDGYEELRRDALKAARQR